MFKKKSKINSIEKSSLDETIYCELCLHKIDPGDMLMSNHVTQKKKITIKYFLCETCIFASTCKIQKKANIFEQFKSNAYAKKIEELLSIDSRARNFLFASFILIFGVRNCILPCNTKSFLATSTTLHVSLAHIFHT